VRRRHGLCRDAQERERTKRSTQPAQAGQVYQGVKKSRQGSEFSRLFVRQLKRKRYSFGPRLRRAPQTEWIAINVLSRSNVYKT